MERPARNDAVIKVRRRARVAMRRARTAARRGGTAIALVTRGRPTGLLADHAALLPPGRNRMVVVLGDDDLRAELLHRCLDGVPGDAVTLVGAPGSRALPSDERLRETVVPDSEEDFGEWLVHNGPVDIFLDLRNPRAEARRPRWVRVFLHLRKGGVYVVPRRSGPNGDLRDTEREWLVALARNTARGRVPQGPDLEKECMRSVGSVTARPEILVIEKQLRHVMKLRDHEATTTLVRRDPDIRVEVLRTLPAQTFVSSARVVSHTSSVPVRDLETTFDVPAMSLRHYAGPIVFGGRTLMHTANSVLADSFRFYRSANPENENLFNFSPRLARVRAKVAPVETLEGDYYQLDAQSPSHFGHVMTEVIARLWGWDLAKERFPDLKALLHLKPGTDGTLERTVLTGYGIADEDIVCLDHSVRVTSLVSASMMWHNWPPFFVHPDISEAWHRIATRTIDPAAPKYDRIFASRKDFRWRRRCVNATEVEQFFAARGFTIVYPEEHTVGEQAAMFAEATTIAGLGGSALFNMMYAQRAQTVIILNQEAYTARNEHLFTAVLGCDVHYFWSTPTHQQPEDGWKLGAYQSDWAFDFDRNGAELAELLDSL